MTLGSVSLDELREKFTEEEIVILLNTQEKFKYVARDNDGDLCIYDIPPSKMFLNKNVMWWDADPTIEECLLLPYPHLFQSIQWEDEEPYKFR